MYIKYKNLLENYHLHLIQSLLCYYLRYKLIFFFLVGTKTTMDKSIQNSSTNWCEDDFDQVEDINRSGPSGLKHSTGHFLVIYGFSFYIVYFIISMSECQVGKDIFNKFKIVQKEENT